MDTKFSLQINLGRSPFPQLTSKIVFRAPNYANNPAALSQLKPLSERLDDFVKGLSTALAPGILQSIADMRRQGSSEIQICSSIGLKLTPEEIAHYRCKSDTLLLDLLWDVEVELVEFVGQYVNYKSHGTVVIDGVVDVSSSSKRVGEFGSVKRKEDADEDAGSSGVGSGSGKGEVGKSDPPMVPKRLVALLLPKKYTSEFDYVEGRMTFGYSRHTTNDRENGIFFNHATKANRK
ncbi:hypothetical protein HK098_001903 [Nowakowskiella sp. JEL0407]|nr:hypothetical protein HK098_001903 [Nowakowskiella sp. JEL0407]